MEYINGIEVYVSDNHLYTKIIKRHKKKRINKKWNKRYGIKTIELPRKDIFVMDNKIIIHTKYFEKLKEKLNNPLRRVLWT